MSASYTIYTEAFIDGKWHLLDPMMKNYNANAEQLAPTYWNGSRSYFGETYDKFKEIGERTKLESLSEELKKYYDDIRKEFGEDATLESEFTSVSRNLLTKYVDKFTHSGYVPKEAAIAFEIGDSEDLWPIALKEFRAVPIEVINKNYIYKEWDNPFEFLYYVKIINDKVEARIDDAMFANYLWTTPNVRLIIVGE